MNFITEEFSCSTLTVSGLKTPSPVLVKSLTNDAREWLYGLVHTEPKRINIVLIKSMKVLYPRTKSRETLKIPSPVNRNILLFQSLQFFTSISVKNIGYNLIWIATEISKNTKYKHKNNETIFLKLFTVTYENNPTKKSNFGFIFKIINSSIIEICEFSGSKSYQKRLNERLFGGLNEEEIIKLKQAIKYLPDL